MLTLVKLYIRISNLLIIALINVNLKATTSNDKRSRN